MPCKRKKGRVKKLIVGIDLGTSTSEIAYVDEDGKVIVIPNSENELVTPSVVHIRHDGRPIVGSEAREYLFTRPESTYMEIKRKFGTNEKLMTHGKIFAPEEIQAHIIECLVDCAEDFTGEDVTGAVITVHAYFTDVQRKQTIRAGELAGIDVKRVINEPTAAAMDYGLQNMSECENILVYDFGGGTLDVTVLELFEGVIDVKSSSGNNQLGGKDFDEALMEHIGGSRYKEFMDDPRAEMKLKQAATECKIALSSDESTHVRIPLITESHSIDITVDRSKFEELIKPLIESTGEQIDTAIKDAGLSHTDLNRVILVGGTTRVPLVRRFVEEKLGITDNPAADSDLTPELMVVRGAAIRAAILDGVIAEDESVVLADVCPFSLGVKVATNTGFVVDPLIKRNITIPYEYSKVYVALEEYQRALVFEIYQGENKNAYENTRIGQLNLDKLPQRRDELAKAEVTFSYDVNGILSVKARALGNDNTAAIDIDINNNDLPVQLPVKLSEWRKADGASKLRPLLRKAQKMFDEYIGDDIFMEERLFIFQDMCDGVKADLIRGNKEEAEEKAKIIKEFVESWKPMDRTRLEDWDI